MDPMIPTQTFSISKKKGLQLIKVRKNSIVSSKNNRLRNIEVLRQTKDLLKWKKKRKYGHRWMAETAFSTMKRMFGEYVSATRFQNMIKEMMIKVSLYNLFRRVWYNAYCGSRRIMNYVTEHYIRSLLTLL